MNAGFKIPTRIDAEPAERRFDPRVYLNFVWRHWMFIGAVVALALLMALIYLVRATPRYTATTQVLLERAEKAPTDTGRQTIPLQRSFVSSKTSWQSSRSDSLLRRVVIKERLAAPPPTAKEPQGADASKDDPTSAEAQSILNGINQPAGRISGVAERAGPGAQYLHHLGRSGASRAARQRGGGCLCCQPARRPI